MSPLFGGSKHKRIPGSGLTSIPKGAQLIRMDAKGGYEANPVHIYHPTPYSAITVLRGKRDAHNWLVCGWYLDTYREDGNVTGLLYRVVSEDEDKQHVLTEVKKLDKDASVHFSLSLPQ